MKCSHKRECHRVLPEIPITLEKSKLKYIQFKNAIDICSLYVQCTTIFYQDFSQQGTPEQIEAPETSEEQHYEHNRVDETDEDDII